MRSIIILSCVVILLSPMAGLAEDFYVPKENIQTDDANRDGSSFEKAIIIKDTGDYQKSIEQEYEYLEKKFGKRGEGWELQLQSLIEENGRFYDKMDIKLLPSGELKTLYFDITDPFKGLAEQF